MHWGLAFLGTAFAQPCDTPASASDLAREIGAAEAAFVAMDAVGFANAESAAREMLPCIDEPLTAFDVAAVHRLRALSAFTKGDLKTVEAGFRSVIAIQPDWSLSERMAPEGTPLRQAYSAAKAAPESATSPLSPPRGTILSVDGLRAEEHPVERPFVLQAQANSGKVTHTDWLAVDAALPDWAGEPPAEPVVKEPGKKRPIALAAASIGSAVVAGSAYGAAWAGRSKYTNEATGFEQLESIKGRTNTATLLATGFGGIAIGTGLAVGVSW